MITLNDATCEEVFHLARASLPCEAWNRASHVYRLLNDSWLVFVTTSDGDWWHITPANAAGFHPSAECPREASARRKITPAQDGPDLFAAMRGADERDALGYDAEGRDEDGYDAEGRDRDGRDRDGRDRDGYDAEGYDAEGYDSDGYDAEGYDAEGYDEDKCNRAGDQYCDDCEEAPCECPVCDSCYERFPDGDLTETLDESHVCDSCRNRYYSWCEECDGYYPDGHSYEHEHEHDCGCESPQPAFEIRNDGCEPLANDTRATVTLPAGTISAEGLSAIRCYLRGQPGLYDLAGNLYELGDQWQTKAGNFTKRLSRHAYKTFQVKITPEILSQVGCIARDHSTQVSVEVEVTRDLNQGAGDFYHDDSCWWDEYSESRCALKTNGGFGLRSFDRYSVTGRAWVMPLRKDGNGNLAPTFSTLAPDAYVVFNGYGDLSGYSAARIVAHMAGWTYRKIDFSADPMWVNAGGYLIAAEDIAEKYTDGGLHLSLSQHASLFTTERVLVNA